ncbi:hypothetical protein CSTAT_01240 [Corynebacterium stationis]|uniref:hypothetical protein n=1 Tax=Corynebacterium stationis TaxID=1705 RepID=UPI00095090C5|nr:hypothetical protein [Corynebacterium stationis]APT94034.1 hypothetical protein CSTAT_01240 [Corynebacterium stationis]
MTSNTDYTTLSPLELAIINGNPGFNTRVTVDMNTGKPYVYIRSDDKEWSGETLTVEQVDALIATLQQARDNAAEYLDVIPFMPA